MGDRPVHRRIWFLIAAVLVVGLGLYTRGVAPWRMSVTNDEMLHLESWRNRYRTDDIYPLFREKVEPLLTEGQMELFETFYASGPIAQRSLFILVDGHPPLFSVIAEITEAITHSSLLAIRFVSVAASLLTILIMYRLGRALRDPTLGLWLAGLVVIGHLPQIFAGIGRSYALAQMAVALTVLLFVSARADPRRGSWRVLAAALMAQATHWLTWPVVGPIVLAELICRVRGGQRVVPTLARCWWYVLGSVMLLAMLAVQLRNPSLSQHATVRSPAVVWYHLSVGSPFAQLDSLRDHEAISPYHPKFTFIQPWLGGTLMVIALIWGVVSFVDRRFMDATAAGLSRPAVRWTLLAALAASLVAPFALSSQTRFMVVYMTVPTIFMALAFHWACRGRVWSQVTLCALVVGFGTIRIARPENPLVRAIVQHIDVQPVAEFIESQLEPGDVWFAHHYSMGNCLYRYAELPPPAIQAAGAELDAYLQTLPRQEGATLIFTRRVFVEAHPVLRRARERWSMGKDFIVVRVPAAETGARFR